MSMIYAKGKELIIANLEKKLSLSPKVISEVIGHKVIVFLFSLTITISCAGFNPQPRRENDLPIVQSKQSVEQTLNKRQSVTLESLHEYLPVIKKYSKKYGFDWRLIIAIIKQESNFKHDAVSPKGAYGLLQIMPETGEEIALNVSYIQDYRTPEENIIAGIHYLWTQFNRFSTKGLDSLESLKLALAAYNAGPGRVLDAQQLATYFGENPNKWENIKSLLPLLSEKYQGLHKYVWPNGRPRSGYFENHQETINYVEIVLENYAKYKVLLP